MTDIMQGNTEKPGESSYSRHYWYECAANWQALPWEFAVFCRVCADLPATRENWEDGLMANGLQFLRPLLRTIQTAVADRKSATAVFFSAFHYAGRIA
ncbi:hypothetical protein KW851_24455 [Pseudomonas sp. PDM33]|uniref:hypothetical protein n=1 Tax=unclassified Pseudomonas TaxID=196821 RepID=UPI0012E05839|nr:MULTISPECIES: hypothetical protein [unclassified Pseudomonas]MBV7586004.1 hypothetical protein [Pseudomonas sp. PDM33]